MAYGELAWPTGSWHGLQGAGLGRRGAGSGRGELARDAGSWLGSREAGLFE